MHAGNGLGKLALLLSPRINNLAVVRSENTRVLVRIPTTWTLLTTLYGEPG